MLAYIGGKFFWFSKAQSAVPDNAKNWLFEYLNQAYALSRTQTVKLSKIT